MLSQVNANLPPADRICISGTDRLDISPTAVLEPLDLGIPDLSESIEDDGTSDSPVLGLFTTPGTTTTEPFDRTDLRRTVLASVQMYME